MRIRPARPARRAGGGLADRPRDPRHDVPVPFALEPRDGDVAHDRVVKQRAIQCALSRVCGLCGLSLGYPLAFLGSPEEAREGAFHLPPLHLECAETALDTYPALPVPVLGQRARLAEWCLVVTGGFELERPDSRAGDPRVAFRPNAVREERRVSA